MKSGKVSVFAPATVSNLGCGFDVFGMAVNNPGDVVTVSWNKDAKVNIKKITGDAGRLPLNATQNTAGVAIAAMLKQLGEKRGVDVVINKRMPLGSGLGSSAASAVAAACAANLLMGKPFTKHELIPFAVEGERIACGSAHADNAAPSMLGGIVLVRSLHPLDIIELPVPKKLKVVVIHPHVEVLTRDARAVLKKNISLKTAVSQWANTAAFVAALYKNDFKLLGKAVTDYVAEPVRASLIPAFDEVKHTALQHGALACSISGACPSMFALCIENENDIARFMKKAFQAKGIKSDVYISPVNKRGAYRI